MLPMIFQLLGDIASAFSGLKEIKGLGDERRKKLSIATLVRLYVLLEEIRTKSIEYKSYLSIYAGGNFPLHSEASENAMGLLLSIKEFIAIVAGYSRLMGVMEMFEPAVYKRLQAVRVYRSSLLWSVNHFLGPNPWDEHPTTIQELMEMLDKLSEMTAQMREPLREFITKHFTLDEVMSAM
jgi:hypothetical protein